MTKDPSAQIDHYVAKAPALAQPILAKIRADSTQQVPSASEAFGYQMPALRDGKIFFYFAAFKNHIGIYPPLTTNPELIKQLEPFRGPKGNLKFPYTEPMPYDLISAVIVALHQQYTT